MITDKELMKARLDFINEYGLKSPTGEYISEVLADNMPGDESRLVVYLSKEPPKKIRRMIPGEFRGAFIDCVVDD